MVLRSLQNAMSTTDEFFIGYEKVPERLGRQLNSLFRFGRVLRAGLLIQLD